MIMLTTKIEAILLASSKPISVAKLKKIFDVSEEVFQEAIEDITSRFNTESSGIHLLSHSGTIQFVTNPTEGELVAEFFKQDLGGDLTRPSLETLTIVAYRGPITKPEIEQIRGVNCSLILRNLLIRGLITEKDDVERLQPVYEVSADFIRHLGIHAVEELPDFEAFHENEKITKLVEELSVQEEV